jgi:hypothetical protein
MTKAIISIAVCLLLVLPSSSVLAGSIRKEGPIEFDLGTPYNVDHTGDRLKLNDTTDPGTWTRLSEGGPGARAYSSYGYDPKGKILLYGGSDGPQDFHGPKDSTWIYDTLNRSWHNVITDKDPGNRTDAAMTFDENSGVYVLFGGRVFTGSTSYLSQDTWVFYPATEQWLNITNSNHPSPRYSSAMVYDRALKKILLYGGTDTTKYLSDIWEFETATAKWTQLPNTNLAIQKDPHLVYVDSLGGPIITSSLNKTWFYNYSLVQWWPIDNPIPQTNFFAGPMVYDQDKDEVIFLLWSLWIYHPIAKTWEQLSPNPSPGPLQHGVIVYDGQTKTVIVQGGIERQMGVPAYDPMPEPSMWQFNTSLRTWSRLNVAPLNTMGDRMAWSSKLGSALIYGGWYAVHPQSGAPVADGEIWALSTNDEFDAVDGNNSNWYKTPAFQAMAYVDNNNTLINVGGTYSLTPPSSNPCYAPMKSFDMTKRNWTTPTPVPAPLCRENVRSAYDGGAKKLVLFGGQYDWVNPIQVFNDTWSYDVNIGTWANMSPTGAPAARANFGMAYASKTGEVYVYAGNNSDVMDMSDLWSYNVTTNQWTSVLAQNSPSARRDVAMTYDSKRNALVIFGGDQGLDNRLSELWLYHIGTSTWEKLVTMDGPSGRYFSEMVYDPTNDRYIVYGGNTNPGVWKCDTWAYDYTPVERSGTFTSPALNLNGTAYFGNLSWKATVTAPSELKFQVRTGNAIPEILGSTFIGPDGTAGSYYTVNNTHLNGVHNSSHYIQYIAYFKAMTDKPSPELFGVDITYNLLHSVKLTEPLVDSTIKGIKRIAWNGTDKDKDNLRYTVILRDVNGANWTLVDNTTSSSIENWDTKTYPNGQYRLTVIARDDNATIPLMTLDNPSWFTIFNPSSNWPPLTQLLMPYDGLSIDALQTLLEWKGDDPDNDPVTFYLYISKDKDNLLKATPVVLTLKNYSFSGTAGTYYWTVIPNDGKVNGSCQSGIWSFVLGTINHAPKVKLNTPLNGTTVKEKNVTLVWNGTDEDNDPLLYFVYLSTDVELVLARSSVAMVKQTNLTSLFRTLEKGKYYWTVIPNDGKVNGTTTSGIWSFTIDVLGPSVTCSIASPQNNTKVKGPLEIKGTASGALGAVVRTVTVRIDGGAWSNAVGTTSWSFSIDTSKLADGPHKVEAQAQSDKGLLSKIVFIVFVSRNNGQNTHVEAPYCMWLAVIIIAVVAAVIIGKRYMDSRKRPY